MSAALAEPLFQTSDVAKHFGVSVSAVQKWTRLGIVTPRRTVRGVALYSRDDIEMLERLREQRSAIKAAERELASA